SSHRVDAVSTARTVAYAAATSSSVSSASGLLYRNISAAAGVTASAAPANSPAPGPAQRRTAPYSRPTAATPSSACGTSIDQLENPNTRPDSAITHNEPGGL